MGGLVGVVISLVFFGFAGWVYQQAARRGWRYPRMIMFLGATGGLLGVIVMFSAISALTGH